MSDASLRRNCDKHRYVTFKIIEDYYMLKSGVSDVKKAFLLNKIVYTMIGSQYTISSEYFRTGKKFRKFNRELKRYPKLYKGIVSSIESDNTISRKQLIMHRVFHGYDIFAIRLFRKLKRVLKAMAVRK